MGFLKHRADCERIEAERRLASELFHADADRLVAEAEQRNQLIRQHAKQKERRFTGEPVTGFGVFA